MAGAILAHARCPLPSTSLHPRAAYRAQMPPHSSSWEEAGAVWAATIALKRPKDEDGEPGPGSARSP